MCKNEEHCIRDTLESVYKYIDTWVVHDTGSTDNTCKIVTEFFEEKGIITPRGKTNWGASSVQTQLKLEDDIMNEKPLTPETLDDVADDLQMALMFNGYGRGEKGCYRDELGLITEDQDPTRRARGRAYADFVIKQSGMTLEEIYEQRKR